MKYGHGIQFDDNLEDGHLDLMMVKEVSLHTSEGAPTDFKLIAKRHGLEDVEGKSGFLQHIQYVSFEMKNNHLQSDS